MNSSNIPLAVVTTGCSFLNGGYGSLRVNSVITHSKPWIDGRDRQAVAAVLESGMLTQGQMTRRFEETVSHYLGSAGAVAVGSGTAALALALKSLELGADAEVILPTYVCKNVLDAVLVAGYTPALCDVGKDWHMTAETVAPAVTRRTRAVVAVHPFGIAVTLNLERTDLAIVEDACQAFGAKHPDGRMVGSGGRIGVVSFHATKCLTTGEGGMAVSDDPETILRMRALRDGGTSLSRRFLAPMSDLQAALGLSQMSRYGEFLERRRELAERYFEGLSNLPVELPDRIQGRSIFFRFPIRARGNFETAQATFARHGIHVRHGVDALLHRTMSASVKGDFPMAETLFAETVSLPLYPALTDPEQETVIRVSKDVWGNG